MTDDHDQLLTADDVADLMRVTRAWSTLRRDATRSRTSDSATSAIAAR
jgi:hypothetical protein